VGKKRPVTVIEDSSKKKDLNKEIKDEENKNQTPQTMPRKYEVVEKIKRKKEKENRKKTAEKPPVIDRDPFLGN